MGAQVDVEDGVPVGFGAEAGCSGDAGVGDVDVHGIELPARQRDQAFDVDDVGCVGAQCDRLTARGPDRGRGRLRALFVEVADDDAHPVRRQSGGQRLADARRSSSDDRDLVRQLHAQSVPPGGGMRTRGWIGRHFRVNLINMKSRGYQMTTRAESTARTADAILDATVAAFRDQPIADITLAEVAERAGVTVQTVLRRFGDKDSVFAAAIERFAHEVFQQRGAAVGLSLPAAVGNLGEHYEQWAPLMLKMLAEEPTTPSLHATLDTGRRYHLSWCEGVFAAALDGLPPGSAPGDSPRYGPSVTCAAGRACASTPASAAPRPSSPSSRCWPRW